MSSINAFITNFCISCIVLGVLFILVPKGALNKSVKYVFCMCLVCCITASVFLVPKPDFSNFDSTDNQNYLTEQNAAVTAQTIFAEALIKSGINFRKITVDTNKINDGSIIINKVTVYTNEMPQKIIELIGSDSYEVVIINE